MSEHKTPVVSVAIPSYNHSKYVCHTIDSIFAQTFTETELIIIDDGSADDSVEVIKNKLKEYPDRSFKFIDRENRGLCRTLNESLQLSKGEYFCYIGSDDFWYPEKLEKQLKAINSGAENTAASYADSDIIDAEGKIKDRLGRQYQYHGGDIYMDLLHIKFCPPSPTNLFLRNAIVSVGGFNENHLIEDLDLWVRIAQKYNVAYIDEPLAGFRFHGENTSLKYPEKMLEYVGRVLDDAFERDSELENSRRSIEKNLAAWQAGTYFEILDLKKARQYSVKAITKNPSDASVWRTFFLSLLGKKTISYLRKKRRENK